MISFRRAFSIALALALVLMLAAAPGMAQGGGMRLRFVHVIPGANAVDIYVDGQLTIKSLAYGQATSYVNVAAGSHHLAVTGAGSSTSIWEQDLTPDSSRCTFAENTACTLVASSATAAAFQAFGDNVNPIALGKARFTAINAISDGAAVDMLLADGRPVIPGLQYDQPYGTLDLPAATYDLGVAPAGGDLSSALVAAQPFNLVSGTSFVALIYGTSTAPQAVLLSAATQPQEASGGYLRIAHALADSAPLDIYVNNTLVAPALALGSTTVYIALPAGTYTLSAREQGATADLATGSVDLAAGSHQTSVVSTINGAPALTTFTENLAGVNAAASVLELINLTADATVSAATSDGTSLLGSVTAGQWDTAPLPPTDGSIVVSVNGTATASEDSSALSTSIYGGGVYTAIVTGTTPQVIMLPPASIAQGIGSAPGAQAAAPTATLIPTTVPTEAAAQPTAIPAQPTAAPSNVELTQASAEVVAQPTTAPVTNGPTARVLTNNGVNLQLRQYPSRESLSLGLAPSGAVLRVNGRAGAPLPPPDQTATPLPPEATEFVDPATVLQPGTDLDPLETWINVTFDTPDGGTVTAWVNALYLGVRDAQGRALALRNLPTVPSNQAGTAQNTAMQPPEAQTPQTTVIVTSVDSGVNVHIRRTPDTAAESLALVPAGTSLEFLGVNDAQDWVFVRYNAPDGTVTGWLSTQFVSLQRGGQAVDFERLQALNALSTIGGDQRGEVVLSGQPTSGVAPDLRNVVAGHITGLNADANLHLRRTPSNQGESLALLPNGTAVVIDARTSDDVWLRATYQGQTGWIASAYVELSFNGQPYTIDTLPVFDVFTPVPEATATLQG